ncbi:MAG: hypothetical protein ABR564_06780 [Candidatus Dormibacteria bacterium]
MIIKVCGVTDAALAEVAIAAGADWIGIVLVPESPRHAGDTAAREVAAVTAGHVDLIGVLLSPTAAQCDHAAERYHLDAVQVHGPVDRGLVQHCSVPVIRAINPRTRAEAYTVDWWPDGLLHLDGSADEPDALPGGTGRAVPLGWAAEVARHRPIILAGGLTAENVSRAIDAAAPLGVDASSGLEASPGMKDPVRVERFVHEARAAFERVGRPAA